MFSKSFKLIVLFLLVSVFLSACSFSLPFKKNKEVEIVKENNNLESELVEVQKRTARLKKFKDYKELEDFLTENKSFLAKREKELVNDLVPVAKLEHFRENKSDDLREADILKQENDFVFAIVRNQVMILRINNGETLLLKKIDFDQNPEGLLLSGKSLIVYGYDNNLAKQENTDFYFVKVFNLDSPSDPSLIQDYSFEGSLNNIFIEQNHLYLLNETNVSASRTSILPKVFDRGLLLKSSCDGVDKCFSPEVFYFDIDYSDLRFFNINVLDLSNKFSALSGQSYLLSEDHKVFSSQSSIFISYLESMKTNVLEFEAKREILEKILPESDQEKIKEFEALSDLILNQAEKRKKITLVIDSYLDSLSTTNRALLESDIRSLLEKKKKNANISDKTMIHRISIDKKNLDYFARTEISASIFNQDSILQKGSYIYLATKGEKRENSEGELRYYSNIYVFDLSLKLIGKMENIASKEEIYEVRFIGNRAYLVSAQEGGSLFVISLKDKTKPEFIGASKLSTSSSYLRPVDENGERMISFSYEKKDSSQGENLSGLRLALLDLSDLKEPKELDSYLIGDVDASSLVFVDNNSFYYSLKDKVLIFPVGLREGGRLNFSGYFAFKMIDEKFELIGDLDHSAAGFYNQEEFFLNKKYRDNSVKRSFVSSNIISSFSNKFFRSAKMDSIKEASLIELISHDDDFLVSSFKSNNPLLGEDPNYPEGLEFEVPVLDDHHHLEFIDTEIDNNILDIPNYYDESLVE